jgi:hypothetical protein
VFHFIRPAGGAVIRFGGFGCQCGEPRGAKLTVPLYRVSPRRGGRGFVLELEGLEGGGGVSGGARLGRAARGGGGHPSLMLQHGTDSYIMQT